MYVIWPVPKSISAQHQFLIGQSDKQSSSEVKMFLLSLK